MGIRSISSNLVCMWQKLEVAHIVPYAENCLLSTLFCMEFKLKNPCEYQVKDMMSFL